MNSSRCERLEEARRALVEAVDAAGVAPLPQRHAVGAVRVEDGEGPADAAEVLVRPGLEGHQALGGPKNTDLAFVGL